jgi:hypothetical protein
MPVPALHENGYLYTFSFCNYPPSSLERVPPHDFMSPMLIRPVILVVSNDCRRYHPREMFAGVLLRVK